MKCLTFLSVLFFNSLTSYADFEHKLCKEINRNYVQTISSYSFNGEYIPARIVCNKINWSKDPSCFNKGNCAIHLKYYCNIQDKLYFNSLDKKVKREKFLLNKI